MEVLYMDGDVIVCIKPRRVLSTDEPGGVPELLRQQLGQREADIRTVHRLDRVVGGVMVLARNAHAASELSRQIRDGEFTKEYAAVAHGETGVRGTMRDLLYRDKARKMTFVAQEPRKGAQEALLEYETLWRAEGLSRVRVILHTGRTHQIRCQFAARGLPLVGERKYAQGEDGCELALWSEKVGFTHPGSGERMAFRHRPPDEWPWTLIRQNG